jgi:hypothetical protein
MNSLVVHQLAHEARLRELRQIHPLHLVRAHDARHHRKPAQREADRRNEEMSDRAAQARDEVPGRRTRRGRLGFLSTSAGPTMMWPDVFGPPRLIRFSRAWNILCCSSDKPAMPPIVNQLPPVPFRNLSRRSWAIP